jgi:hypothetical protein
VQSGRHDTYHVKSSPRTNGLALHRSGAQPAGSVQEVSVTPLVMLDSRRLFPLLQASTGSPKIYNDLV